MMGLFKKPNRKFRQRVTRTDSEDEETQNEHTENKEKKSKDPKIGNVSSSSVVKEKSGLVSREGSSKDTEDKSDSQPGIPAAKLLSFHDEEDDAEVFKLKKSNYSRRLAKQLEKERKKRQENSATSISTGGQKSTLRTDVDKEDDLTQAKDYDDEVLCGKEAEDMDVDDESEDNKAAELNPFKDVLQSGIIPDAATIYAMKKHRQLAREMKDFIPVETTEKEEESQSRLIREDDNDRSDDDDDDEEPSRLSFNLNTSAVERQKVREAFLSLQDGSQELENEDAAELERWEREQIRKGVSIAQGVPSQPPQLPENEYYAPYLSSGPEGRMLYTSSVGKDSDLCKSFPTSMPGLHKSELTTAAVKARLEERLASLKEQHETHEKELGSIQKDIVQNNELIDKYEKEAPENASRFQLYQQMRGYVRDLVECLDMKVADVDLLDHRMMDLYKTRAKALTARRQQDVRDQADEYSILSCKVLKGSISEISKEKNGCLDEVKLRRAAEREGRRIRRRKQREYKVLPAKHHDGMSSDDEEPDIEIIKFKEKKETLIQECSGIFEDVVEEFGTLAGVMSNFEKWKNEQNVSYCDAYVPLCLPKIFAPFVRIQLLGWNPCEDEMDLEGMQWYKTLVWYGSRLQEEVVSENDPDINLLPAIVEKTIIPKITAFVKDVWDPMSTKQTMHLVNLINKLYENYPSITGKSKQVQTLLQSVCVRIQASLDDDVFIPLYPKELLENRSLGSSAFFQRQFWSTVKLLKNIVSWEGIIAEFPLEEMALSSLLNRYLLMGLNTSLIMKDSLEKCKTIVSIFPKNWFVRDKQSSTLPMLKQFSLYLVRYAQSLKAQSSKRSQTDEDDVKCAVIDIVQLLITMGSLEEAVILAKEFSISGFKKTK